MLTTALGDTRDTLHAAKKNQTSALDSIIRITRRSVNEGRLLDKQEDQTDQTLREVVGSSNGAWSRAVIEWGRSPDLSSFAAVRRLVLRGASFAVVSFLLRLDMFPWPAEPRDPTSGPPCGLHHWPLVCPTPSLSTREDRDFRAGWGPLAPNADLAEDEEANKKLTFSE